MSDLNLKMVALRVSRSALDSILGYARACYPREAILLLRGKASEEGMTISEVVVPPLAVHGYSFSNLPLHMLPIDFSILGIVHSHPSGGLRPSVQDLNRFYGKIMMIVAYPFTEQDLAAFNSKGEQVPYTIVSS